MDQDLSNLSNILISSFEEEEPKTQDKKVSVNPVISKVATWYEKLRNAMDYRDEEVVLRAAIERILKRRILLKGTGKTIAEPLVRELVWARYFPDESLSESLIETVEKQIDLYIELKQIIILKHKLNENLVTEWIYQLASSDLQQILAPNFKKQTMINYMFQILSGNIEISDDDEQTKDAQVFIAVRRSFAKDDIAFLRYHLFTQFFGPLTQKNIKEVGTSFIDGYKEIEKQLNYPIKEKIFSYVKRRTGVFLILEDLLNLKRGEIRRLVKNEEEFKQEVFNICNVRYKGLSSKIKTAIVRSVIFILFTKAFIALGVEGTFESLVYGKIYWMSIILNTAMAPILMIIVGLSIKTPGKSNSELIFSYIKKVLFEQKPQLGTLLKVRKSPEKEKPILNFLFNFLWFVTFILAFGAIVFVLTKLHFNAVSQLVFVFFLAIVSFLSYRISQQAHAYNVEYKKRALSSVSDFLFMPFISLGRHLTEGVSQINFLLFIFDFVFETPFKGFFGFLEQWFLYLQAKREKLE